MPTCTYLYKMTLASNPKGQDGTNQDDFIGIRSSVRVAHRATIHVLTFGLYM